MVAQCTDLFGILTVSLRSVCSALAYDCTQWRGVEHAQGACSRAYNKSFGSWQLNKAQILAEQVSGRMLAYPSWGASMHCEAHRSIV